MILRLDKQGNIEPPKPKPFTTHLACERCGKPIYLRRGKRGPWLSCSGFPKCRARVAFNSLPPEQQEQLLESLTTHETANPVPTIVPVTARSEPGRTKPEATGVDCEECGKPMIIRHGRRGPFLGCSGYPKCRHTEEAPPDMLAPTGTA
jgi:DNA topoisomerase-1